MQVSHLKRQSTDHDICTALKTLSEGLSATLVRALHEIDSLPRYRRDRARRLLLRWVVCSVGYVGLYGLADAVVIEDIEDVWDRSRCINRPHKLISDCANLVEVVAPEDPKYSPVRLIHASVDDFLLTNPQILEGGSLPEYHLYLLTDAHMLVTQNCIQYILLSPHSVKHVLPHYARVNWPAHVQLSESTGLQLLPQLGRIF